MAPAQTASAVLPLRPNVWSNSRSEGTGVGSTPAHRPVAPRPAGGLCSFACIAESMVALVDEIRAARKEIVSDGYEMSVGELINLYRDNELKIDPAFQRLFRWDDTRKTRFV